MKTPPHPSLQDDERMVEGHTMWRLKTRFVRSHVPSVRGCVGHAVGEVALCIILPRPRFSNFGRYWDSPGNVAKCNGSGSRPCPTAVSGGLYVPH